MDTSVEYIENLVILAKRYCLPRLAVKDGDQSVTIHVVPEHTPSTGINEGTGEAQDSDDVLFHSVS